MKTHNQPAPSCLAIIFFVGSLTGCAAAPPADVDTAAGGAAGTQAGGASTTTAGGNAGMGGASAGGDAISGGGTAGQSQGTGGASSGGGGASDAGSGGGGTGGQGAVANAIESILVPADGQAVVSKTTLDSGELFLLKATGTVDAGGVPIDAEYGGFTAGATGQDLVSGIDVGVDVGFKIERAPKGMTLGRKKWFGSYRTDHTYYVIVTGTGTPMSIKLIRSAGSSGTGTIAVSLIRLSPSAPALAPALDTIMANYTKPTVHSTMITSQSLVYLLQASGSGKVGGLNLGEGDADWMDYAADGTGKVDIGDQNVDYGLGVDESDPKVTPRLRWWGPWRKDHSYYILFAGTGNPIGFSYYDVGDYGDNTATQKLTVHVFSVP